MENSNTVKLPRIVNGRKDTDITSDLFKLTQARSAMSMNVNNNTSNTNKIKEQNEKSTKNFLTVL
jgi:hypothetical protein